MKCNHQDSRPQNKDVFPAVAMGSIRLVMFDMAGTTGDDRVDGVPLVVDALMAVFAKIGIPLTPETITPHRGKQKLEAIQQLLKEHSNLESNALKEQITHLYDQFQEILLKNLSRLLEIEGTSKTFRALHDRGISIAVESGFPLINKL